MKNKIVFIGNSIVNGFPMSRGRSFPGLVRAAIKGGETSFHGDVINKGVNGETTEDILRRFSHDVLDHEPRLVFIMTGTNDFIYREAAPEECIANLSKMAEQSEAAGILPVYMTPLPVHARKASRMWMSGLGIDYGRINGEIESFSEMIRQSGIQYVDTWAAWSEFAAGEDQPLQEEAYLDGVHPTPEGQQFLAETVLRWLEERAAELGLR